MTIVQYQLLTAAETAVASRVSAPTVYRLVKTGELPAAKIGGQLRIDAADVDRLLHGVAPSVLEKESA